MPPGNSELNLSPTWVALLKVSRPLLSRVDQWTRCLQALSRLNILKLRNSRMPWHPLTVKLGPWEAPFCWAHLPEDVLHYRLYSDMWCFSNFQCLKKQYPSYLFEGFPFSTTRPAGTTLGRGPLNSLLLYGTGPLSELGVHKNDFLFAILVKAQPGPSLSLPSPFLFPSLKGNEGFQLNQNGRGLWNALATGKPFCSHLDLKLFMLTPKRWRSDQLANFISTKPMSLKWVQKRS